MLTDQEKYDNALAEQQYERDMAAVEAAMGPGELTYIPTLANFPNVTEVEADRLRTYGGELLTFLARFDVKLIKHNGVYRLQRVKAARAERKAMTGSNDDNAPAKTNWRRMETAEPEDYETVLVLVRTYEGDGLTHRLAMWDPELPGWTVFGAKWDTAPEYWMPLEPPPADADGVREEPPLALTDQHVAALERAIIAAGFKVVLDETTGEFKLERLSTGN